MYFAIVILLLGVLPIGATLLHIGGADTLLLLGKWYVFFAVGVRLLLAGIRQMATPHFTAREIFAIDDPKALAIVRELGFGTFSIGTIGIASLWLPGWIPPAAVAGGLFYGLAGVVHVAQPHRNAKENLAMITDFLAFAVLAVFLAHVAGLI